MKTARFWGMMTAILLFCIALYLPNSFYELFITKNKLDYTAASLNIKTFQGVLLQEKMLKDPKYLPIFGSSELSRRDTFHPSRYFMDEKNEFTPFLIGRGGSQSLVHFLDLAAVQDELKNRKIVFVLSPQWFIPSGIDDTHFSPNYSALQTYSFALSNEIDPKIKKQAANRLLHFSIVKKDPLLVTQLKALTTDNKAIKLKAELEKPVAYTYLKVLEKKDFFKTVIKNPGKHYHLTKSKYEHSCWNKDIQVADAMGKQASKTNQFGILDSYYQKNIGHKILSLKNYKRNSSYGVSPEYGDLQMVLDILKKQHTKALFISIPVNGPWYDYAGFPKQGREVYYQKVKKQVEQAGFPVADFSNHEYDKYFLEDTIHIGPKGWVYIDRSLNQFYTGSHPINTAGQTNRSDAF
jgi:D-alanine transfer protein